MLTDAELARMQATANSYLPDTAIIQNRTRSSDGGGGYTETYTASGTVPCRVGPIGLGRTGAEDRAGDRISAEADFMVTLPVGTTVDTDDRIVVGPSTFNVVAVRDRSWPTSLRAEVTEVE